MLCLQYKQIPIAQYILNLNDSIFPLQWDCRILRVFVCSIELITFMYLRLLCQDRSAEDLLSLVPESKTKLPMGSLTPVQCWDESCGRVLDNK
jgi:hypothetical protein